MRVIYKHAIEPLCETKIVFPEGSKIIHFDYQIDSLYLWAEIDIFNKDETRQFAVIGTGNPVIEDNWKYISTCFDEEYCHGSIFVWHLYEVPFSI